MIAHFRIIDLKKALKQVKEKTTGQKVELYNRLVNYRKSFRRARVGEGIFGLHSGLFVSGPF